MYAQIFGDGSLGAETAALRSKGGGMTGVLIHEETDLHKMISDSKSKGFRVEIHAIGDAAAETVLSAMRSSGIAATDRPILTHCQVLGDDLIDVMSSMGVIAAVQPSFVPTDMRWVSSRIDPEKQQFSYAWKTLLNRGVYVAGGSDAPIETSSPFIGMFDAMFRSSRETEGLIFREEEQLTFAESLWIYTYGSAYAAHCEHELGMLAIGFAGDFVMLDSSILEDPKRLHSVSPDLVVGKI